MATLRASEIFSNSRYSVIIVESVDLQHSKTNTGCRVYGDIAPVMIIVCGAGGSYALDMEAKLVAFDHLSEYIPELESLIASQKKEL